MNILNWTVRLFVALTAYALITELRLPPYHPMTIHRLTRNPPPQHHEVTGIISWQGPDHLIANTTPLTGCISDVNNRCDPKGEYISLFNGSSRMPIIWSSPDTAFQSGEIAPSQRAVMYIKESHRGEHETPPVTITVAFDH